MRQMIRFWQDHEVPHEQCELAVTTNESGSSRLVDLKKRGRGIHGILTSPTFQTTSPLEGQIGFSRRADLSLDT